MNVDDLGRDAARLLVAASRSAGVPSLDAVRRNRRRRSGLATGSFIVVVAAVGTIAAVVLVDTETIPAGTTDTTTTVSAPEVDDGVFMPPLRTRNDGTVEVTLTLLDGSTIVIAYPDDLDLTSWGFGVSALGAHGDHELDARPIEPRLGSLQGYVDHLARIHGPGRLVASLQVAEPRVERWEFGEPEAESAYLLFEFGPWSVAVWDWVAGDAFYRRMSDEDVQTWADGLRGFVDSAGFLVLTAEPPLRLVPAWDAASGRAPDASLFGPSGGLSISLNECDRMLRLDEETYDPPVFAWCHEATNTLFFGHGRDAEANEILHRGLEVRLLDVPGVVWQSALDRVITEFGLPPVPLSDRVPGFEGTLVTVQTRDGKLEATHWPSDDAFPTAGSIPNDWEAAPNASGEDLVLAVLRPTGNSLDREGILYVGGPGLLRPIASGVRGFAWHAADPRLLAWVEAGDPDGTDVVRTAVVAPGVVAIHDRDIEIPRGTLLAWGPEGFLVSPTGRLGGVRALDGSGGERWRVAGAQSRLAAPGRRVTLAADGSTVLTTEAGALLHVAPGGEARILDWAGDGVADAVLSADGRRLAIYHSTLSTGGGTLEVRDLDGNLEAEFGVRNWMWGFEWSPDGRFVTGVDATVVVFYDTARGTVTRLDFARFGEPSIVWAFIRRP